MMPCLQGKHQLCINERQPTGLAVTNHGNTKGSIAMPDIAIRDDDTNSISGSSISINVSL